MTPQPSAPSPVRPEVGRSWRKLLNVLCALLALVAVILGFAVAVQVKLGLEEHRFLRAQASRKLQQGQPPPSVPSRLSVILRQENRFLSASNFRLVFKQTVIVGIAAVGMTMIIISGGIDLSVGSVIALAGVVTALCLVSGVRPAPAALAGILVGGACGLVNSLLITVLRVVPFIATLGMWGIARGVAKGLAGQQKIDAPAGWLGTSVLTDRPELSWLGFSPGVWVMLLSAVLMWAVLRYAVLGRYTYAVGSNEAAARLCGIRVWWVKVRVYVLAGLFTGMAGVMQFCRLTVGDPTTAIGAELDVIAAVVIGGGSLSGGEGSVLGSLLGALIMGFLRSGCSALGAPNWIQEVVIGAVIVLAVALDQIRRRRMLAGL